MRLPSATVESGMECDRCGRVSTSPDEHFSFCPDCRLFVCETCWDAAGLACQGCAATRLSRTLTLAAGDGRKAAPRPPTKASGKRSGRQKQQPVAKPAAKGRTAKPKRTRTKGTAGSSAGAGSVPIVVNTPMPVSVASGATAAAVVTAASPTTLPAAFTGIEPSMLSQPLAVGPSRTPEAFRDSILNSIGPRDITWAPMARPRPAMPLAAHPTPPAPMVAPTPAEASPAPAPRPAGFTPGRILRALGTSLLMAVLFALVTLLVVSASIALDSPSAAGTAPASVPSEKAPPSAAALASRTYVIRSGDTLRSLAERFYGDQGLWPKLFDANRHLLSRPEDLRVGTEIVIPGR